MRAGPQSAPAATGDTVENQLWVEKHKPQRSMELVGNATLIHTLRQWLFEWWAPPAAKHGLLVLPVASDALGTELLSIICIVSVLHQFALAPTY